MNRCLTPNRRVNSSITLPAKFDPLSLINLIGQEFDEMYLSKTFAVVDALMSLTGIASGQLENPSINVMMYL